MKTITTPLADLIIFKPVLFEDARGHFFESFNQREFIQHTGFSQPFVQENQSCSQSQVLRGLHYQIEQAQGKLVRVVAGEIFDVAVDLRRSSPTFGQWHGFYLSAENKHMAWIPPGFAHGFLALANQTIMIYKITDYYAPQFERCIIWNDVDLNISWPLSQEPLLSAKDAVGKPFKQSELFA